MASYTFFTNPMSRGQIARWALHEVGADYEQVIVEYGARKPAALLAANGLGKLPTLVHHTSDGDYPIAETSAICAYLAETESGGALAPTARERAAYYRWMFFAAGPLEQAITARSMGFEPNERQRVSVGFGCYDLVVDTLAAHLRGVDYVCGDRFTMADVYLGSHVLWGTMFKTLPELPEFVAYGERLTQRTSYVEAKAIDHALIAAAQAAAQAASSEAKV